MTNDRPPSYTGQDLELAIFEVVADTPFGRPAAFIGQMCLFMTDHIEQLDACLRKQFYPVCKKVRYFYTRITDRNSL